MTVEQLYIQLNQRRQALEANVFAYPPTDWNEFQRRFGQWIELSTQIETLTQALKGAEPEEPKL